MGRTGNSAEQVTVYRQQVHARQSDHAEVVSTRSSDGLVEQFLAADTLEQLAHFLHEFLSPAHH